MTRRLTILSGLAKGAVYDLSGRQVLIGRADENDIVLEDTDVSRRHVALVQDGTEYRVRDLGAINGIRINGKTVSDGRLAPGDSFDIGLVQAKYEAVAATAPAAPAAVAPAAAAPAATPAPPLAAAVVRKSEYELQLDGLSKLNRELNLQLLRARQDLHQVNEQTAPPAEVSRLKQELAATRGDVEKARESVAKIEELTTRNRELSAQVAARDEAIVAVRQEGEQRLQRELQVVNQNLAQAQSEIAQVRREAEDRVARESTERVRLTAELQQVHVERERLGQELTQTHTRLQAVATELTQARSDLEQVRTGSARLDEVLSERHQLQAQFDAFRQQSATDRQQLESTTREAISKLQRQLEVARREVELHAKKATAKITVPAGQTAELERVRGELDQTRAQLEAARRTAERVEQLTRENQELSTKLTGTQEAIANLRTRASVGTDQAVVESLRSELAASRAELRRLTERPDAPRPASAPAFSIRPPTTGTTRPAALAPARPADPLVVPPVPSRAGHLALVITAFLVATAVGGGAIWYFNREPERHLPFGPGKSSVVGDRLILEEAKAHPPAGPVVAPPAPVLPVPAPAAPPTPATPAVPAGPALVAAAPPPSAPTVSVPAVPKPATLPGQPAAAAAQPAAVAPPSSPAPAALYLDPAGRFNCKPPAGWKAATKNEGTESRVLFTAGRDEILVIVQGTTWPDMQAADGAKVTETAVAQFRLRHPNAYAEIKGTDWQPVGESLGFQVDFSGTLDGAPVWVRVIEYRAAGRSCTMELVVRSLNQQTLLQAVFAGFLSDFRALPAKTGS